MYHVRKSMKIEFYMYNFYVYCEILANPINDGHDHKTWGS